MTFKQYPPIVNKKDKIKYSIPRLPLLGVGGSRLIPFWKTRKEGKEIEILFVQEDMLTDKTFREKVLPKVPMLQGKKIAGVNYIEVERGNDLFSKALKWLKENNYYAVITAADEKRSCLYKKIGFTKIDCVEKSNKLKGSANKFYLYLKINPTD